MNVQMELEYSLYLAGGCIIALNVCNSLKLSCDHLLGFRDKVGLSIRSDDMRTHISPPGMIVAIG